MSILQWFSRKSESTSTPAPSGNSSGLTRMEATRPVAGPGSKKAGTNGSHKDSPPRATSQRKAERLARRELLYQIVRESMIRVGVLSASYKFKVLSLDPRGRQFMVMMDLAQEFGGQTQRLAEIEALIAQSAKTRHGILVTAVYWRMNEHVATGRPSAQEESPLHAPVVHDAHQQRDVRRPAPARYEPIQEDEVQAFKKALASGVAANGAAALAMAEQSTPHARHSGPRSYTLLTGFEETEAIDPDAVHELPDLSGTQYGELR